MDYETYEALKEVTKKARLMLRTKYEHRKRLNQIEIWDQAMLYKNLVKTESWINEVSKTYN